MGKKKLIKKMGGCVVGMEKEDMKGDESVEVREEEMKWEGLK